MWEKDLVCKYCQHSQHVTEDDVNYADLRSPLFIVPDYQYFVICTMCGEKLVLSSLPSDVAVVVQGRTNESNNNDSE